MTFPSPSTAAASFDFNQISHPSNPRILCERQTFLDGASVALAGNITELVVKYGIKPDAQISKADLLEGLCAAICLEKHPTRENRLNFVFADNLYSGSFGEVSIKGTWIIKNVPSVSDSIDPNICLSVNINSGFTQLKARTERFNYVAAIDLATYSSERKIEWAETVANKVTSEPFGRLTSGQIVMDQELKTRVDAAYRAAIVEGIVYPSHHASPGIYSLDTSEIFRLKVQPQFPEILVGKDGFKSPFYSPANVMRTDYFTLTAEGSLVRNFRYPKVQSGLPTLNRLAMYTENEEQLHKYRALMVESVKPWIYAIYNRLPQDTGARTFKEHRSNDLFAIASNSQDSATVAELAQFARAIEEAFVEGLSYGFSEFNLVTDYHPTKNLAHGLNLYPVNREGFYLLIPQKANMQICLNAGTIEWSGGHSQPYNLEWTYKE